MEIPTLIYCAGGNPDFYKIAITAGFEYGAQLPNTVYGPLYFADQDWKHPNREVYVRQISIYKPYLASVLDWEKLEQLPEVLAWAEDIAPFVQEIMIIPKVQSGISFIPRTVGGRPVRLGYSVPTKYGGTSLMVSEFYGWPVHLLGGSPQKQIMTARYLDVVSADGNMAMKMATQRCAFYEPNGRKYTKGHWVSIQDADGQRWNGNGPNEAFRRSCQNIIQAWKLNR